MPDSIKFTELPSGTLSANSIFATAEEAGGGSYASTKVNAANVGNYLVGALQYAGINTEDKTVEGALNELLTYASNIAEEYDSTATYDEGDFVIYEGVLYKCTTAISTPEAWTPAHWTSTLVVDNFGSGGASVTLGTSAPLDASGENGDLYVQYEALTYKVVEYFVKINNSWRKSPYSRVVALTQAEYDLITPDSSTLYIITDAQSSYQKKFSQYDATVTTDSGGFFSVTLTNPYKVLSAWADQGDVIILPFPKTGAGNIDGNITWWFKVTDQNLTVKASTVVDIHFLYI